MIATIALILSPTAAAKDAPSCTYETLEAFSPGKGTIVSVQRALSGQSAAEYERQESGSKGNDCWAFSSEMVAVGKRHSPWTQA